MEATPAIFSPAVLFRRKRDYGGEKREKLARHLGWFDLTLLGVGSTLGAGVYVITGVVARNKAGPAIVISFAIAAVASIFAGLAYAEFGSRTPFAGSAYVYSYYAAGELVAFIAAWQLILEYIIGAASVARAWSAQVNSLTGNWIQEHINDPMSVIPGSDPDILSLLITLLLSAVVAVGVKESTTANNALTLVNLAVVSFVVIAGLFYVSPQNWEPFIPPEFGTAGIFAGAATAFFSFIGFDVLATCAEETIKPEKNIPIGIVASLVLCAISYIAVSAVVTLMVPYSQLSPTVPLSNAFQQHGADWANYIIVVGAMCGLTTSLMASLFPLPRIVYAISSDGLLWPWIGRVSERFKTPVVATAIGGTFAGLLAFALSIDELADMMSIGTLLSYTLVAGCVVVLRFEPPSDHDLLKARLRRVAAENDAAKALGDGDAVSGGASAALAGAPLLGSHGEEAIASPSLNGAAPAAKVDDPSSDPKFVLAVTLVLLFAVVATVPSLLLHVVPDALWSWVVSGVFGAIGLGIILYMQFVMEPYNSDHLAFKCPGVPTLPLVSMAINIFLIFSLSALTWIRFAVWLVIGLVIFFTYSVYNSKLAEMMPLLDADRAGMTTAAIRRSQPGGTASKAGEDENEEAEPPFGGLESIGVLHALDRRRRSE